mgnify:CR=1 FL=1
MNTGTQVELLSPKPGDYLVFYIDVGKMPMSKVEEYMKRVKDHVNETIADDGIKRLYFARPWRGGSQVETMSIEEMRARVAEHDKLEFINKAKSNLDYVDKS